MRTDIDRQRVRIGPLAPREHVAHRVQTHGATRLLAPALEQGAAFRILVRQGLAVVAARDTGADLRHLHQAVPQPVRVDLEVLSRCRHRIHSLCLPCSGVLHPWQAGGVPPDRLRLEDASALSLFYQMVK